METKLTAVFAGGCFWCMEGPFESEPGVIDVSAGYTGGKKENPTYEEVSSGTTGHIEAIQIVYDSSKVSYRRLLEIFWRQIDPTDAGGQFADRGPQYKTAIFYHDEEQKKTAENSKNELGKSGPFSKPIATLILPLTKFYPAEDYHQDYHRKNPFRYNLYRTNSGRDDFLEEKWGHEEHSCQEPAKIGMREKLTPMQYEITRQCGTEPPFQNEYWNNKREGIYADIVSGEPLFSSKDKFDSGTGWPSFTKPLVEKNIVEKGDDTLSMARIEVRSKKGNSHLGHVFDDGPGPSGLRYCINSASLRFIPKENLEKEGYGEYKKLFEK